MRAKSYVALIPARGGSESIHRKNLQRIGPSTLIERAVMSAQCSAFSSVYLTTEDKEIASHIPASRGVKIIDRPPELATNDTPMNDVVLHALSVIDPVPDYLVLLQPTSPFRTSKHVTDALRYFMKVKKAKSLMSVTEVDTPPEKMLILDPRHRIQPYTDHDHLCQNRQVFGGRYRQNGAIYIVSTSAFQEHPVFCIDPCVAFHMGKTESIDIDDEIDLEIARFFSERSLNNVG